MISHWFSHFPGLIKLFLMLALTPCRCGASQHKKNQKKKTDTSHALFTAGYWLQHHHLHVGLTKNIFSLRNLCFTVHLWETQTPPLVLNDFLFSSSPWFHRYLCIFHVTGCCEKKKRKALMKLKSQQSEVEEIKTLSNANHLLVCIATRQSFGCVCMSAGTCMQVCGCAFFVCLFCLIFTSKTFNTSVQIIQFTIVVLARSQLHNRKWSVQ